MTKSPKIVGEHKKEFLKIPPPPKSRIILPADSSHNEFEVYITKISMDKIMEHCKEYSERRLEVMGFLIGDVYKWKKSVFILVKDVATTDLESTNISVRFDKGGYERLFDGLDDLHYDYVIVGWYHSHPGLGCFLSSKDVDTQKRMFKRSFHTALVVDPIKKEMKAYKLKGDGYVEKRFAVYTSDRM